MSSLLYKFNRWMSAFVPDAFSIAVILSLMVMLAAKLFTPSSCSDILLAWGGGFWTLLSFSMQMCLVMLTGYLVADSPYVRRLLHRFSQLARDGRSACVLMAGSSMVLAWLHWGLGLIASAVLVRFFAIRQIKVHYPLLVACGYFGLGALWHAGLSGSAPLLVSTPGHFLESNMGVIPFTHTIFTPWNCSMTVITLTALTLLAWFAYPHGARQAVLMPTEDVIERFHEELVDKDENAKIVSRKTHANFAEFLQDCGIINFLFALCALAYLGLLISNGRWQFDLNLFNFIFFTLAIALHKNVKSLTASAMEGAKYLSGIIVQFPLYAGMYGIIKSTGLSDVMAHAFLAFSNSQTFPLAVYWYSGILNYFVPSGGSKWAIEAPYLLEAARELNVKSSTLVLSYAWGDMVTDLIQPFRCLPLLAASGMEFRQIAGYLTAAFVLAAAIGSVGVLVLGFL